jgi:hypothetical protein
MQPTAGLDSRDGPVLLPVLEPAAAGGQPRGSIYKSRPILPRPLHLPHTILFNPSRLLDSVPELHLLLNPTLYRPILHILPNLLTAAIVSLPMRKTLAYYRPLQRPQG